MIAFVSQHYHFFVQLLIVLAVMASIGALVYFKWYRPRAQREERESGEQVEEFPVPGRHRRSGQ
jgi:hypothetical protein